MNIPYDIIHKLRQLPRHSKIDDEDLKKFSKQVSATGKEVLNLQKNFKDSFSSLADFGKSMVKASVASSTLLESSNKLQAGIGNLVKIQQEHNKTIVKAVEAATYLEEKNKELNKSYGISSARAQVFANSMREVAKTVGVGDEKLFKYAGNLKEITAGFMTAEAAQGDFNMKLLAGQSFMQNNINLSEEQANKFEMFAQSVGTTAIDMSIQMQGMAQVLSDQTGLDALQIQKDIMQGIAETSVEIQGQYSKMPGQLELAVLKASKLGITMNDLHKTGDSLLNIESSVGSELEYQMLTGRRLLDDEGKSLTNAYRMATIKGDGVKQAELLNKFIEEEGDNLENNMFARKKAAELFGMEEGQLMRMKRQREMLADMGLDQMMDLDMSDLKGVAETLREEGASPEEIADFIKKQDTRTSADRTADATEALLSATIGEKSGVKDFSIIGGRAASEKMVEAQLKVSENFRAMEEGQLKAIGSMELLKRSTEAAVQPLQTFSGIIPAIGTEIKKLTTELTAKIPSIGLGETFTVTDVDDAYITSEGQVIRPSGNDNAIFYEDGGPFDPARAQQFDYERLAAAMTKIKVVAQTEREVGSSSTLNGQYNYG